MTRKIKPERKQVLVDPETALEDPHKTVQTIMGKENAHLHQCVYKNKFYSLPHEDDIPNEDQIDYSGIKLNDLLSGEKQTMTYEYDFGDSWTHAITLEKKLPFDKRRKHRFASPVNEIVPLKTAGALPGWKIF